jgi:ABC-2 type transport system ATP-binding protein
LADSIAILDTGRIIREGTSPELKACCGGDVLIQVHIADLGQMATATELLVGLTPDGMMRADPETGEISLSAARGTAMVSEVFRALDAGGVALSDVSLRQPTLDDVFLRLTGRTAKECEKGVSSKSCNPG